MARCREWLTIAFSRYIVCAQATHGHRTPAPERTIPMKLARSGDPQQLQERIGSAIQTFFNIILAD